MCYALFLIGYDNSGSKGDYSSGSVKVKGETKGKVTTGTFLWLQEITLFLTSSLCYYDTMIGGYSSGSSGSGSGEEGRSGGKLSYSYLTTCRLTHVLD